MKRLLLCLGLLAASCGCLLHRSGSQAIEFNPFDWGSSTPALRPADGSGYINGVPQDQR
jgi:hypothetical protein